MEGPMQPEESGQVGTLPEGPAATYRALAEGHADRAYRLAMFIVGDPPIAEEVTGEAFRRTWGLMRDGKLVKEADETLYWYLIRLSAGRARRSRDLRGHLPPTTADDRQITATGILSEIEPQQRAGVLMAAWGGLRYQTAGVATGLGERRVRDLTFAARQEYREARGGVPDVSAECGQVVMALSERADGAVQGSQVVLVEGHLATCSVCQQTAGLFDEFSSVLRDIRIPPPAAEPVQTVIGQMEAGPRRPTGMRRIFRVAAGPAVLVLVLILGLFVFRACEEPSIVTGVGRTPDLIYAADARNGETIVLDSGSGKELSRLPAGVLDRAGQRLYGATETCTGSACATRLTATETATMATSELGTIEGRYGVLAAPRAGEVIYLADQQSAGVRLAAFDVRLRRITNTVEPPAPVQGSFVQGLAALAPDGEILYSIGMLPGGDDVAVMRTHLSSMEVRGWVPVSPVVAQNPTFLPWPDGRGLSIFLVQSGAIYDLDFARGVLRTANIVPGAAPPSEGATGGHAAAFDGTRIYAIDGRGGIAVMDRERLEVTRRMAEDRRFRTIALSSDGKLLYALDADGNYAVLRADTGERLLRRGNVQAAGFLQVNAGE